MSRELLIQALKDKGEKQIAELWQKARDEAEKFRVETEEKLTAEEQRCDLAGLEAERAVQRRRTMAARRRAEAMMARAEQELNERLRTLARDMLGGESFGDRTDLVIRLAGELPAYDWGVVRVNGADRRTAAELFPQAEIVADAGISGGLVVTSSDGRVTIDNTLSTRLERAWPKLGSELLQEMTRDETAD